MVKAVGELFDIAVKASPPLQLQAMARDKLFEMLVLTRLLRTFRRAHPHGRIEHRPQFKAGKAGNAAEVIVAGKPALADRSRFSHFDLFDEGGVLLGEAWTSVEFESLSWAMNGGTMGQAPRHARHELDVCILEPGAGKQPAHWQVYAGVSCKDVRKSAKENVREALGLRRETAFLSDVQRSLVPWLVPQVPADPGAPILLASSDVGVRRYASPVDNMGVYVRFVRRPWEAET
ncbi:hypothetical protein WT10_02775 [Burkholderia stagnalis]|nr:hypothetical protein WS59_09965 [Burkholderia stagnalis]KVN21508.1 hypothetical protein WT10_02775 [Burkholderia stagnalis]KWI75695.1 hypothetical protein WT75_06180 [Burkholderia stagnalis]KWN17247.1 hypothetical protein WT84_18490 [Burkholderia stagnalis]KWN23282.1 hypothetical protein WT85_30100 [Burkholderia stagnalis]